MSTPTKVVVREPKDALFIEFSDGQAYTLPAEYLRVYSPSAEVRGHGTGNETLQFGKRNVTITSLVQAGNYALQITFSDGHDSGIYGWEYLKELGETHEQKWSAYLQKIHQAGLSRDIDSQVIKLV
ncbi:MAG: gamma-butyrobetaine hydroxylase-like domain-containing protein [Porticoccaceae bacterium]